MGLTTIWPFNKKAYKDAQKEFSTMSAEQQEQALKYLENNNTKLTPKQAVQELQTHKSLNLTGDSGKIAKNCLNRGMVPSQIGVEITFWEKIQSWVPGFGKKMAERRLQQSNSVVPSELMGLENKKQNKNKNKRKK